MTNVRQGDPALPSQPPTGMTEGKTVPAGGMPGDQLLSNRPPGMHRGDAVPAGTPGSGENTCPVCGGSGRLEDGDCAECGGTGKVIEAVAGGP